MNEKLFWKILDEVRLNLFFDGMVEPFEPLLQILVWAKLSAEQKLPLKLRLETAMAQKAARPLDVLISIGKESKALEQAFSSASRLSKLGSARLRPVFDLVLQSSATGLLQSLDPAEILASLLSISTVTRRSILPAELARLMVELADLQKGETLYIPWDHNGQLAAFAARHQVTIYLETTEQSTIPVLVSLLVGTSWNVNYGDPIHSPSAIDAGKLRQFDTAIAFPPFNRRWNLEAVDRDWFGRFPERTQSGPVLAVRHLLAQARHRVVVAVQNSLLFSAGAERMLRESLVKCGNVQAVIAMPGGLLTNTNMPFALLVLDPAGGHQSVTFVNADTPRFREPVSKARAKLVNAEALIALVRQRTDTEDAKIVAVLDVLINDAQLQVGRYVRPASELQLCARIAESETVSLDELVSTFRPMPTISGDADSLEVHEVGAADLPEFGYVITPGRKVKVERHTAVKNKKQFLQPYDIVLIVKGSVGKVGIIPPNVPPPGLGGWVAGQSAIVLRTDSSARVDPRALAVQLRSPVGRSLMNSIRSGATIPLIQLKELNRLLVLLPDPETARRAVEALEQEARLQREISRLEFEQEQCSAQLWQLK